MLSFIDLKHNAVGDILTFLNCQLKYQNHLLIRKQVFADTPPHTHTHTMLLPQTLTRASHVD